MAGIETNDPTPAVPQAAHDSAQPADAGVHTRFASLDVSNAREALARLHEQVSFHQGRVEIKRRGSEQVCVMISKSELEALETALEILAGSTEYKAMCEDVARVAAATGGYAQA